MVSAKEEEVLRILDFVGKKKTYGLERLLPAIDVVS